MVWNSPQIYLLKSWFIQRIIDIWKGFHFAILELLDMLPHHEVKELVIETCREPTVISHQYFITPLGDYCKLL
jgi:hypothetical protein